MLKQSFAGNASPWGPMQKQSLPEGLHPVEETNVEQFGRNCSLWEGLMLEKQIEDCVLWEGPVAGSVD